MARFPAQDLNVKIGDFGLATQLHSPQERHLTMCGTPNFISPEVATRSSHGLEADIWGLGCLLYTLLVGTPPFDTTGVRSTLTKVYNPLITQVWELCFQKHCYGDRNNGRESF